MKFGDREQHCKGRNRKNSRRLYALTEVMLILKIVMPITYIHMVLLGTKL